MLFLNIECDKISLSQTCESLLLKLLVSQYVNVKTFQFDRFQTVYSTKNWKNLRKASMKENKHRLGENIPGICVR